MLTTDPGNAQDLLRFNRDILDAALAVVAAYEASAPRRFAEHAGPHLRHVIEHYEALVAHGTGPIDYDARPRDREVERSPAVARSRLGSLRLLLTQGTPQMLAEPVVVCMLGGVGGEHRFTTTSTLARELMFVASHAVHHFAVIRLYAAAQGVALDEDLGKAPATVAHERSTQAA